MSYTNPIPNIDLLNDNLEEKTESDYTKIDTVYFAFIDVLGFKKTFEDSKISKKV